jgi:UDP-N-acetylmuramoyl-tripeptide--D-alanyl-D-alanine ligase
MKLSELTSALNARGRCRRQLHRRQHRQPQRSAGQLFVALTGPRFDGHDYLAM